MQITQEAILITQVTHDCSLNKSSCGRNDWKGAGSRLKVGIVKLTEGLDEEVLEVPAK
jgi:hypothetical protein